MSVPSNKTSEFNIQKSLKRARRGKEGKTKWALDFKNKEYSWSNRMERIGIIRQRLPYDALETISKKAGLSIKQLLTHFSIPQTTYNKKKRENELLSERESEMIVLLIELLDFGQDVFNNEIDKFHRWLRKPNISLGGNTPNSLFDSMTGIQEVRNALHRLEYGNLA